MARLFVGGGGPRLAHLSYHRQEKERGNECEELLSGFIKIYLMQGLGLRLPSSAQKRFQQINRNRKHGRRVILCCDFRQGLQVA